MGKKNTAPQEVEYVLTEQDLENNPSLATEGLKVGDTINYDPNATDDEAEIKALSEEIAKAETVEELDTITSDNEDIVKLVEARREEIEAVNAVEDDKPKNKKGVKTLKRGVIVAGKIFEKGFEFDSEHPKAKELNKYA